MATAFVENMAWDVLKIGLILLIVVIFLNVIVNKKRESSGSGKGRKDKIHRGLKGSGLLASSNPEGFIFGKDKKKKVYLSNTAEGHIAVFGGSGKGKTSALLIPSLRAWGGPFFTIDISGDISRVVADENSIILAPDEPDISCSYNIFHNIDTAGSDDEKRKGLEKLVNLIVEIPENTNDTQKYFLTTGRKILLACMLAFYYQGRDFVDICKTVFFNNMESLVELVEETKNDLAIAYITPLIRENEKNVAGGKSALDEKIKLFADTSSMEKILKRKQTSFDEVLLTPADIKDKQIFLKVPDEKQELYQAFLHIVTGQILEYINGREFDSKKDKRILLALDEFASLGYFEILAPFRKFRKYGANICILTQSIADIDLVYSEKEREIILDNSNYIAILSANDTRTREYFSGLVGKEEQKQISKSSGKGGTSTSSSTHRDYAINPEEWRTFDKELVVIHPGGFVKLDKNYYFKEK